VRGCCWLVVLSACGRFGFDASSGTGDANGVIDGATPDIALAPGEKTAYIKAHNTDAYDVFGWSIALSLDGNTLAVGAPLEDGSANTVDGADDNGRDNSGAVYVFVRTADSWSQQAYIKPSVSDVDDQFGYAVALSSDGNTLAVGAPTRDSFGADSGAAFVFTRTGTTWSQEAVVTSTAPGADDWFGASLALAPAGDSLAVGAFQDDGISNTVPDTGAVFIFDRVGTSWGVGTVLREANQDPADAFGYSVAFADGDRLAVGAPNEDGDGTVQTNNAVTEAGAVFVFTRSGVSWTPEGYLKAPTPTAGDFVGKQVSIAATGDVVVAAAAGDDSVLSNSGAAYVYTRAGTTWFGAMRLKATMPTDDGQFGATVAISGDGMHCAIGAPLEDGAGADTGTTYLYDGTTGDRTMTAPSPTTGDQFGAAVALSSDGRTRAFAIPREDGGATGINAPIDDAAEDSGAVLITYFGE
jgi:hypothetical protein